MALVVAVGTIFAFGVVLAAHANTAAFQLDAKQVPRGSAVWGKHTLLHNLADWYSIPAFLVVVGVAIYSSRPKVAARMPKSRVRGNWLVAGGVTLVAIGSSTARYGHGAVFSIFLALGAAVMFAGFVMASRQPHEVET
ncbi:MAG: hypothetical protein LC750_04395 [Actinobacteria bacterium]|nr:hypothetical protein [Actinomycetota bacterium]